MDTLPLLGTIFLLGGILIWYIGHKRGAFNTELWALFPIAHAIHEYIEYAINNGYDTQIYEQLELTFAIGSSIALLAASIEILGAIPKPFGKLIAATTYLTSLYYVFTPEQAFETLEKTTLQWGSITTTYYRFYYGFILVLFSIAAIIASYIYLYAKAKQTNTTLDKETTQFTISSTILLLIFSTFEGFTSNNQFFILLRGISAIMFLLIPIYAVITSKHGLQKLLITTTAGNYLLGYDFKQQQIVTSEENVLAGSFIAAITTFATTEAGIGEVNEIQTTSGAFLISRYKNLLITITTRTTSDRLQKEFIAFTKQIANTITTSETNPTYNEKQVLNTISQHFSKFT